MRINKIGLCLALALSFSMTGLGASYTENGVTYSYEVTENDEACVSIAACEESAAVKIPSQIADDDNVYMVTSIGQTSYDCCENLASVEIPTSVTSISERAFQRCSSLTSVTIPGSVTSIGDRAFYDCTSLTSVTIPNSVTSIGEYAFNGCSSLTSVTIPGSVTSISDYAFGSCSSLKSVTIPPSVTSIGSYAFSSCTSLTSVTIPGSVTSIGDYTFGRCSGLTSVLIPNSVESIGYHAFTSTALKTVFVDLGYTEQVKGLLQSKDVGVTVSNLEFIEVERPPEIRTVAVTKVEPFGLAIDYTVADVGTGAESYVPEVTLTLADKTTYTAKTLSGDISATKGNKRIYWNMAKDGIESFTEGTISVAFVKAPYCVIDLTDGTSADSFPVTYLASEPEGGFTAYDEYKTTKLVLKRIDAGEFIMGEDQTVEGHCVKITKPFYMALFETTQKQWMLVTDKIPTAEKYGSYGKGDAYPIHCISYDDIRGTSDGASWPKSNAVDSNSFLGVLRAKTSNLAFDLPTEAQWEYACRAGTTTKWSFGNDDSKASEYMWYSSTKLPEVGTKKPNPWGLYDMHGSVYEWCLDWYAADEGLTYEDDASGAATGTKRVRRGGCFGYPATYGTSFIRDKSSPSESTSVYSGFRLSLPVEKQMSANAVKCDNVAASVIVDGATITDTLTIDYLPTETEEANIFVDGYNMVVASATKAGQYEYRPTENGKHTITHYVGGMTMLVAYNFNLPPLTVSDVTVKPIKPFGLAIDYTVGNVMTDAEGYVPEVTLTLADKTTYTAKTLSGDTGVEKGSRRLYWNLAADGIESFSGATVSVTYKGSEDDGTTLVTPATAEDVSATVLTQGSKISEAVTINCAQIEGAAVTVTVNGETVDTSSGTYRWLPNKVGENKIVYTINGNDFTVTYDAVERAAVLTSVKVQKVEPFGVAIDYTYTTMEGAQATYKPFITATAKAVGNSYLAKTVTGPISLSTSENKYRVYWNMAADGNGSPNDTTIHVTLREDLGVLPEYCVVDLSNGSAATEYGVSYLDLADGETTKGTFNKDDYKKEKLVLKRVDPGEFIMGSDQGNTSHKVTLTQPFYLGLFETTQKQWSLVTGGNPSTTWVKYGEGDMYPVFCVSYDAIRGSSSGRNWPSSSAVDSGSFLGKLRARTGLEFDLPTEAQWEYACRAGTTTEWSFGNDSSKAGEYMWYSANADNTSHEVGLKDPNPWGFYDMYGNIMEFCLDWNGASGVGIGSPTYGIDPKGQGIGEARMRRGGLFQYSAENCRSSSRNANQPNYSVYNQGLRLALRVAQKESNTIDYYGVTASIIKDGATLSDGLTLNYLPTENDAASLLIDGETVVNSAAEAGKYEYCPTENGLHTFVHSVGGEEMSVTYNFKLPPLTVSDLTVQKVEPFGLVIDYKVDNIIAGSVVYIPEVTLTVGKTTYTAKTLWGDMDAAEGSHRLYWNMAADEIGAFENATVSVSYKEKESNLIAESKTVSGDGLKYCVIDLTAGKDATSYPLTFLNDEPDGGFTKYDEYKTTKLVLKRVKAGEFIMGESQTVESHKVTLSKPFYMGLFEVTQAQWDLVMGLNPSGFASSGEKKPVENVTYNAIRGTSDGANWPTDNKVDADSFLGKLRARTGLNFDLPTEAQWEYACRAGTTTKYSYGESANDDYMWYKGNADDTTHDVGGKTANPWGFYDMHGNVFEWCLDWYGTLTYGIDPVGAKAGSSIYRVVCGGSWYHNAASCVSSINVPAQPSDVYNYVGFRLARTLQPTYSDVTPAKQTGLTANIIANGGKVDDEVTINCEPFDGADVTIVIDGVKVALEGNSYAWLPNKVGNHTIVYTLNGYEFTATYDAVERPPVITVVGVIKVAPFGLAIDYAYTMMEGAKATYAPVITATEDGSTVYAAKTLTEVLSLGENKCRVYWNMAADDMPSLKEATISVMLKENVADETTGTPKVSQAFEAKEVETSVIADGAMRTDTVIIDLVPTEDTEVSLLVDGTAVVEPSAEKGCYSYRPSANGAHTIEHVVGTAKMSVTYSFNLPPLTVSDVTAKPIKPFGLAIDYTVANVMTDPVGFVPEVTLKLADGKTTYTATALSGDTDAEEGAHRLYWNLAADGIASFEGATVSVTYKEKDEDLFDEQTTVAGDGAKYCVIDLSAGKDATSYPLTFLNAEPEDGFNTDEYKTTKLVLKRIELGSFIMDDNQTVTDHKVTLTKAFYMGLFEITQAQWELVMGTNPSKFQSATEDTTKNPVDQVTYDMIRGNEAGAKWPADNKVDAGSFLGILRERTGLNFDLPTEAQWEYACRAGTTTDYSYGDSADGAYMWYVDNSTNKTHEVGTKKPNPWGLYDIHGNVYEWCLDWHDTLETFGTDPKGPSKEDWNLGRVLRGGGWNSWKLNCESSSRYSANITYWVYDNGDYKDIGFRLSRTLPAMPVTPATVKDVEASVIAGGTTVTTAIEFGYLGEETAAVSIKAGSAFVVENATSVGTKSWQPSKPGDYTFAYVVGDTTVFEATYNMVNIPMSFSDATLASFNYKGDYDGKAHGISLVDGCDALADIAGATVTYKVTEEGDYKDDNPLYTDVITQTVWYQIMAKDYETYTGTATVIIDQLNISGEGDWECLLSESHIYSGREWTQGIDSVKFKGLPVTYTVTGNKQKNAGNYTLKITGNGNFTGSRQIAWSIGRKELVLTAASGEKVYDGTPLTVGDVTANGFVEGEGAKYKISSSQTGYGKSENVIEDDEIVWDEGTSASNYSVTKKPGTLVITKRPVTITSESEEFVYNGNAQSNAVITIGGMGIVANEGITTFNWATVASVRQGEVTNTFKYAFNKGTSAENYEVTVKYGTIKVVAKELEESMFSLNGIPTNGYVYDGNEKTPEVTCQDGSPFIIGNDDFSVKITDNIDIGTATVTITGKNNYKGTVKLTFTIGKAITDVTFDALGGKMDSATTVTLQQKDRVYNNLPAEPTREGYEFKGWYLNMTSNKEATANGKCLALDDHTLYARWDVDSAVTTGVPAYKENGDGTVTITGIGTVSMTEGALVLPDMIDGMPVTEIADKAFLGAQNIKSVTLPIFLERVGYRAFHKASALKELNIPSVRDWNYPYYAGTLTIGGLAFAETLLSEVCLPEEVAEVGAKAFNGCQLLETVTILGAPTVGENVLGNAGIAVNESPTIRLNPALVEDETYQASLSNLTKDFGKGNLSVAVRTDAVVESVAPQGISIGEGESEEKPIVELPVAIEVLSNWGDVDTDKVFVEYSESLEGLTGDPSLLKPKNVEKNGDGTFLISVPVNKKATSGFFRVKILK